MEKKLKLAVATILAVGMAMCGYFVCQGIVKYAEKDRCVTVKGLSEREVLANRVTWPMSINLEGNDLDALLLDLRSKKDTVVAYLYENGVDKSELTVSVPDITDRIEYEDFSKKKQPRYSVSLDVTVNSHKVEQMMELMSQQTDLLAKGVRVSSNDYRIEYDYTDLSSLKPEMVEEATHNARNVALKFAQDAECSLGSIREAVQGQFTMDTEYYRPQYKSIRVVTTISYYLK